MRRYAQRMRPQAADRGAKKMAYDDYREGDRFSVDFRMAGQMKGCWHRSEEHTSELQSLMRNSYAVFCLKKKKVHRRKQKMYRQLHREHTKTTITNKKPTHK